MGNDTYSQYNDHPLRDVPPGVLDTARECVKSCIPYTGMNPDLAIPLADSVVYDIIKA